MAEPRGASPGSAVIEPAGFAVAFGEALRRAGVPMTTERIGRFARAILLVPPGRRDHLYWTARISMMSEHGHLPVFDAVFAAIFDGMLDPADHRGDPTGPPPVGAEPHPPSVAEPRRTLDGEAPAPGGLLSSAPQRAPTSDESPRLEAVPVAASSQERLRQTAFADLEAEDLAAVQRLVRRIVLATPLRRTRRTRSWSRPTERLDLRRTLRRAQRTAGDPVRLVHRRRRQRSRRLVLLCDVSGSMEPYTRIFLSLLQGAVAGARAEAFVFSTRLTRLTRQLAARDPDQALASAARTAPDWAGGTRLAESLRRFLDSHGRRGLARGAVVVILSDGWEHDDPLRLTAEMARLQRLSHRIVWVNPRKSARGFAPLAGGMAAALPYCDAFVSGHSLAALDEVASAISAEASRSRCGPHPSHLPT